VFTGVFRLTDFCSFLRAPFCTFEQIIDQKIELKVESKIGSLSNIKHKPGGGDKKVFNDVEYLRQTSANVQSSNVSRTSSRRESTTQVKQIDKQKRPTDKNIDKFILLYFPLLEFVSM
jgi:hypothetical protein